jgi:hypothetical protein
MTSIEIVEFNKFGAFQEKSFSLVEILEISHGKSKHLKGNFSGDQIIAHDIGLLASTASHVYLIPKRFGIIFIMDPIRALILADCVLLFSNRVKQKREIVEWIHSGLKELLSLPNPTEIEFHILALEALLSVTIRILREELLECKMKCSPRKAETPSSRLTLIRLARPFIAKVHSKVDLFRSTIEQILTNPDLMEAMEFSETPSRRYMRSETKNTEVSSGRERGDELEMILDNTIISIGSIAAELEECLKDSESEETSNHMKNKLQEYRLFQMNTGISLVMASATVGVFITGLFTMMFSPPPALSAGGSFPNSKPKNPNTYYPNTFLILTLTLSIFLLVASFIAFMVMLRMGGVESES